MVGNGGFFRLAAAMRHHPGPARIARSTHRLERLGQRADLVGLDQQGIGCVFTNTTLDQLRLGHEKVIANQLHPTAQGLAEQAPVAPLLHIKASALTVQAVAPVGFQELRAGNVQPLARSASLA